MSTNCGCEPKKYNLSMGCCVPVVAPADQYYTKYQTDKRIEEAISGITGTTGCCITPEEVSDMISAATDDMATEQWVEGQGYITGVDLSDYALKSEIPVVPTNVSAFNNDAGYLTEHQSLKTINGQVISGTGNIEIETSGTPVTVDSELSLVSTNPVQNKVITEALNGKLDASAYTPVDLSIYATKSQLIQYVTNLQNQIDSLKQQISGCCGDTGETLTRWITMTGENDYTCSGTTKMTKEKEQQSDDGGNTWTDTGNYRTGDTVIEENCVDCGYVPGTGDGKIHFYRSDLSTNTSTTQCVTAFTDVSTSAYPRNYEFEISGDTVCGLRGMTASSTVVRSVCSVIMPSSTRVIDDFAFYGEAGGEPEQMSSRDRGAVIALNEGLEEIGIKAFYYYVQDTNRLANGSIIIPSTVTSIGLEAFNLDGESFQSKNLSGLKIRFYFKSQTPPSMLNIFGTDSSQMNSAIRIYVPVGTTEAYRQALGSHYSAMEIVEYDGNITYASDVWSHDNLLYQGLIQ